MSVLPNLIVGGVQKSGTTYLHHLLDSHPDIFFPASPQEIHFFDMDASYRKGVDWYAKLFRAWNGEKIIGQTSPLYIYVPEVASRIHAAVPDVRLIFILRDPVDRAYSHYWHEVRYGWEPLSFEEALSVERRRLDHSFAHRRHFSYVDRGRYAEQLDRYAQHFAKSQILLLRQDELREDVGGVCQRLAEFLAVDVRRFRPDVIKAESRNGARLPRCSVLQRWTRHVREWCPKAGYLVDRVNLQRKPYPPMSARTRDQLKGVFAADFEALRTNWQVDTVPWQNS